MSERAAERTYTEAEVEERLKEELPQWKLENGWIRRKYKTRSWKGTLMVINTVGHLAEAAWHHPDITASYAWVEVRLMNHAAKGITDKDFELAKKIEEVVQWQPGKAGRRAGGDAGRRPALRLHQIRHLSRCAAHRRSSGRAGRAGGGTSRCDPMSMTDAEFDGQLDEAAQAAFGKRASR